jgi:hypothetical protein
LHFITEHSIYWLIPAFVAALGLSVLSYWKESRNEFTIKQKYALGSLRFAALFLLFFLLLHPLLMRQIEHIEKPLIIIAQDNSQSLAHGKDSSFMKNEYLAMRTKMIDQLSKQYEVQLLSFGEKVRDEETIDYQDAMTDISAVGDYIYENFGNRNIGALILSTDGIFNQGINPLFAFDRIQVPIYTLASGDTSVRKDLSIQSVRHNKIAFRNNKIPVEIAVHALQAAGEQANLELLHQGKLIFSKKIDFNANNILHQIKTSFVVSDAGLQYFELRLTHLNDEITYLNNQKTFYIDVLESKEKIGILYEAPHPDISALKQSLNTSLNYEVEAIQIDRFEANIEEYNLLIMYGLPSIRYPLEQLLQKSKQTQTPLFFILSNTSDMAAIDKQWDALRIDARNFLINESGVALNDRFDKFSISESMRSFLDELPPLYSPYGKYDASPVLQTLLFQKIGALTTDLPLLAFAEKDNTKYGILTGEGIWRWRLTDYRKNKNHLSFDEFFGKIVQYLSLKIKKKNFVVSAHRQYSENENVKLEAQVYNETYEPVLTDNVKLLIYNSKGEQFAFQFVEDGNHYSVDAGRLPPGKYHYVATASNEKKTRKEKGQFVINPIHIELSVLQANHHVLHRLAKASGGRFYQLNRMKQMTEDLLHSKTIKPNLKYEKRFMDLMDYLLLLGLIVFFLALEWFLRKRLGIY